MSWILVLMVLAGDASGGVQLMKLEFATEAGCLAAIPKLSADLTKDLRLTVLRGSCVQAAY